MKGLMLAVCALCRAPCRATLCAPCRHDLSKLDSPARCPQCATPTPQGEHCGKCLRKPPHFDRTVVALNYLPPLTLLIKDFKFYGKWQLAALLADTARPPTADVMIPTPLYPARERWRGFNQARELARALPPPTPPLFAAGLRRIKDTPPQSELPNATARRDNVRDAFAAASVKGTVLVVDDVMTTGSTLNEIAGVLKKAGAAAVINLVIARTLWE